MAILKDNNISYLARDTSLPCIKNGPALTLSHFYAKVRFSHTRMVSKASETVNQCPLFKNLSLTGFAYATNSVKTINLTTFSSTYSELVLHKLSATVRLKRGWISQGKLSYQSAPHHLF